MWFKCYGFNGTMEARLAVLRVDSVYLLKKKKKTIDVQCVYCGMSVITLWIIIIKSKSYLQIERRK